MFRPMTVWLCCCCLLSGIGSILVGQTRPLTPPDTVRIAPGATDESADTLHYLLDEIVVTGTRTHKKIIDIPYSVQRIDNSQFKYDRKVSVDDVLGTVPGLFLQSRYGNHDVRISIRGFGSRSNSGIRGVRILLDGIPESEPDGQTRIEAIDFNSVGSIEVVKGNASSLYTNAPGGVINFINDIDFPQTFAVSFNDFGSYNLRRNGFKTGIRSKHYRFLLTYSYHNADGFRDHSKDYWHIMNTVLETKPNERSSLQVLGYYVNGLIRLPGSLTRAQFDADPFQANSRDVARDAKRITQKGRVGLRFRAFLDEDRRHEMELTTYGTIKYFERTSGVYRIINRYGLGASGRYVYRSLLAGRENEFSAGGDLLLQTGPIEFYQNINGRRSDILTGLTDETIGNSGFYFQNGFNLMTNKLDLLLTGRYDKVIFDQKNQILSVQNARRRFEAFTPKAALNYKLMPSVAVYTSFGRSFESPAGNELDNFPTSSSPNILINPDLKAQKSRNFELGIKGNLLYRGTSFFNNIYFEGTFFNSVIDDEIVPFELFGDVFFRNAARTNRSGLELGANVELVPGVRLEGAYTFSDFQYDEYSVSQLDSSSGLYVDRSVDGRVVPSVPRHNLSLNLSFEQRLSGTVTGFMKGNLRSVSGMYADDLNSAKSEGYDVLSINAGLDLNFGRFNLLLNGGVNNITDQTYIGFININSQTGEFFEAGEPRNYFAGARLGLRF